MGYKMEIALFCSFHLRWKLLGSNDIYQSLGSAIEVIVTADSRSSSQLNLFQSV